MVLPIVTVSFWLSLLRIGAPWRLDNVLFIDVYPAHIMLLAGSVEEVIIGLNQSTLNYHSTIEISQLCSSYGDLWVEGIYKQAQQLIDMLGEDGF